MQAGTYRVSSPFGMRSDGMHRGIDIASVVPGRSYLGAPIFAAEDATVVEARGALEPGQPGWVNGFGGWLWLRHRIGGATVDTIYGHVYPANIYVKAGQQVKAGQHIADVGGNGGVPPHLHFEVWTAPGRVGGTAVDPLPWLVVG